MKKTTVLYHADCTDGFTAAWVAKQALSKKGEEVTCLPVRYDQDPPDDIYSGDIYIVDFSYKRDVLLKMKESMAEGCTLTIIDHHKTAQAELEGIPDCIFDMDHCGSVLTWKYFFPEQMLPLFLEYVEDWDLYKLQLPGTRELREFVSSFPKKTTNWVVFISQFSNPDYFDKARKIGEGILRWINQSVEYHLKRAEQIQLVEGGKYYPCCVVSDKRLVSVIGHALAEESGEVGVCLLPQEDSVEVSLRSTGKVDVYELAKANGGGGHHNAAGFHLDNWTIGSL